MRFTAIGALKQMRLEVFDAAGNSLFNSGLKPGNIRDWSALDNQGQPVPDGPYLCVVTVSDLSSRLAFKQGTVLVEAGRVSLSLGEAVEAQGLEEEKRLAAMTESAAAAVTLATHDGHDGQVTSTTGALTTVTHDSTLTGTGSSGSPLGVALPLALSNSSASPTLTATNSDPTGNGLLGIHSALTGTAAGVRGETNSTANEAVGVLGIVNSTAPGDFSAGVRGINNGTTGFGIGVYGSQAGSGWGVYGTSPSGRGVFGESNNGDGVVGLSTNGVAGIFQIANNANSSDALVGSTNGGGSAVRAITTGTGHAGFFRINNAANIFPAFRVETNGSGAAVSATSAGNHGITGTTLGSGFAGVMGTGVNGSGVTGESVGAGVGVYGISSNGNAGKFEITNSSSLADALVVNQAGDGEGVTSVISKSANTKTALRAATNGSGQALFAKSTGTGNAGFFEIDNSASTNTSVVVKTNGQGHGMFVEISDSTNRARAIDVSHSGIGPGVFSNTVAGNAIWGIANNIGAAGVIGDNRSGEGVVGRNKGCFIDSSTLVPGCDTFGPGAVVGRNDGYGAGVRGFIVGTVPIGSGPRVGVLGQAGVGGGTGNAGKFENIDVGNNDDALIGTTRGGGRAAIFNVINTGNSANALEATTNGIGRAAYIHINNAVSAAAALEVTTNGTGNAARFVGPVTVVGNFAVTGVKAFKIDHPLDPANKFLYHSAIESPDMMNIYNGNVVTDARGLATVTLPSYFQALNRDFRYQLTVIGRFAQAIVFEEIKDNQFKIKTNKPRVKVSWQVSGVRQDAWAETNRVEPEQEKTVAERGSLMYPEFYRRHQNSGQQQQRAASAAPKGKSTRTRRNDRARR